MVAAQTSSACQIFPALDVGPGAVDLLTALLAAVPLPSVLITPVAGTPLTAAAVRPLVGAAQARHCAALLLDDAALARTLRADGVHLSFSEDLQARYEEARSILGGGAIVGVDVGGSRHMAMELGEAGADYIGFSADPAPPSTDDFTEGPSTREELLAWWSEVFEVPCVAIVEAEPAVVGNAAAQGADFVAVRIVPGGTLSDRVNALVKLSKTLEGRA